ncbi:MAG TPA: FkbM family methyltransferase [Caulobacteraceae bacterium]|nr:FkbM family methyltransferase [Caulobacteraceae bacterium]
MDNSLVQLNPRAPVPQLHQLLPLACRLKVVDVGANPIDGDAPYAPLLAAGHTEVVGFEPNPDALAKLNQMKGPNETYLPHAVGDGGRRELKLCLLPGMTSILEPNHKVLSLFHGFSDWGHVMRRVEVDTVRLDDTPETAGLDLLKIDIQGGELLVFQNAPDRLASALVIHTEVEFMPMYVGQPLFSDVDMFLRGRGFMLHRLEPMVTRDFKPLLFGLDPYNGHSQILWADAIYVRDLTRLEMLGPDQLLKAAVILHDCYRSYDVALYLLREYDQRTGRGFGDRYLAAITSAAGVT